ncbi:MAG: glycosyltransferase family 4 protein [Alphaproteobacteria bacterium]|nr:glycosyltransferase family 4 protein [Alphaproteobacteria bacterium]
MTRARIFYVAKSFGVPMGGVAMIFRHVEILVKRGFDAHVYLLPGEDDVFVRHTVPVVDGRGRLEVRPDDIFVLPEPWPVHLPEILALPVRKFVFCQNHYLVFSGLGDAPSYRSMGIERVFAVSRTIAEFLERDCGATDVRVVPCVIDTGVFRPLAKRRQIAFMPRKVGMELAEFIRGIFRSRYPAYAGIAWVPIDRMPIGEVAARLGEARWFLSLTYYEGFGLPPLEAMAADAIVAGFHGGGGLDYATPANGFWCPTGDFEGCVDALARAVEAGDSGRGEDVVAAGRATVAKYGAAAQESALVDFWTEALS